MPSWVSAATTSHVRWLTSIQGCGKASARSSQIRSLVDDIRGGSKAQWPITGFSSVTITVHGGLGFMALQPIKENIASIREDERQRAIETKDSRATIVASRVKQKELE